MSYTHASFQVDWVTNKGEIHCTNIVILNVKSGWNTDVALWWAGAHSEQVRFQSTANLTKGLRNSSYTLLLSYMSKNNICLIFACPSHHSQADCAGLLLLCSGAQSCQTLLQPYGLQPASLLCTWDFPGENTGVGCHFLLQGNFPTQGSKPHLLHW